MTSITDVDTTVPTTDDEYQLNLKNIVADLNAAPSKVSERGIRRLAKQYSFEVFEDTIPGGIRISLGGTIVLIDIDFVAGKVANVAVSMASNIQASEPKHSFMSQEEVYPSANHTVLSALRRPRLDKFGQILEFLSKADKLSTSIDCFRILDEVTHALFLIHNTLKPTELDYSMGYGRPIINSCDLLGLGVWYWTAQRYVDSKNKQYSVNWGYREIPKTGFVGVSKYAVKYSQNWIKNAEENEWNDVEPLEDAAAEFVLILNPPVHIPEPLAKKYDAVISSKQTDSPLNTQWDQVQTCIYVPQDSEIENGAAVAQPISFSAANILPYLFVQVSHIPIEHPKKLQEILDVLRRSILIRGLWESATVPRDVPDDVVAGQADKNMSLIDYMMEFEELEKSEEHEGRDKCIIASACLMEQSDGELGVSFKVINGSGDNTNEHVVITTGTNAETKQMELQLSSNDPRLQHLISKLTKAVNITEDLRVAAALIHKSFSS